jgi:UDP:flavonoid glycosyltransferase YjiC (YdhE family)
MTNIGILVHPVVAQFLYYSDSITHGLGSNKMALQPLVAAAAEKIISAVEKLREEALVEFTKHLTSATKNVVNQKIDVETSSLIYRAKIAAEVNKEPIIASVVAKYTAEALAPSTRVNRVEGSKSTPPAGQPGGSSKSTKKRSRKSHKGAGKTALRSA